MRKNAESKKDEKEPLVGVVVLNWNGKEILKDCLNSFFEKTNYKNYKIVVVDNGSVDGSIEMLKKEFAGKIDIVANEENYGFPAGMNIGIRYLKKYYDPDYYLLLNNDTLVVQEDWLKNIVEVGEKHDDIGILSPVLINPDGSLQRIGEVLEKRPMKLILKILSSRPENISEEDLKGEYREIDVLLGACVIVKKEIIENLGMLDERYSPYLVEDVEFSFRAKRNNYKVVTVLNSKLVHYLSHSFKTKVKPNPKKDIWKSYVVTRNTMLFSLEFFGIPQTLIFALPVLFMTNIFERKDKLKDLSLSNLEKRDYVAIRFANLLKAMKDAFALRGKPRYKGEDFYKFEVIKP